MERQPRVLPGARPRRRTTRSQRQPRRHQRADGARSSCRSTRTGCAIQGHDVLSRQATGTRTTARGTGSTPSSTSRRSPAGRSVSGTDRVCASRRPAPGSSPRSACCRRCARTRTRGRRTSSTLASSSLNGAADVELTPKLRGFLTTSCSASLRRSRWKRCCSRKRCDRTSASSTAAAPRTVRRSATTSSSSAASQGMVLGQGLKDIYERDHLFSVFVNAEAAVLTDRNRDRI